MHYSVILWNVLTYQLGKIIILFQWILNYWYQIKIDRKKYEKM